MLRTAVVLRAQPAATAIGVAALGMAAGMCKNPQVDVDSIAVAELMADVAAAVARQAARCARTSTR